MNIDNNFNSADAYLEMAKEKVAAQNYEVALVSLRKAYSHIRDLIEQVYKLHALKSEVTEQKGD